MATAEDATRLALALAGTTQAPHFDRTAFKVSRTYATLSADGSNMNLKLAPDEQALKCLLAPEFFKPVPNAWGAQGWTTALLPSMPERDLADALAMAWKHAVPARRKSARRASA